MKYKILLAASTAFLFLGCFKDKDIKPIRALTFNIGFESQSKFKGVYYDHAFKDSLFYFADPITEKEIKFFDQFGNLKDSISLVGGIDEISTIQDLIVVSRDTIMVSNNYSGKISAINKEGEVWYSTNLDQYDSLGNYYEYKFSNLSNYLLSKNTLLATVQWYGNKFEENKEFESEVERIKYFYRRLVETPHFVKISNVFSETPERMFGVENFYAKFTKEGSLVVEGDYYSVLNDKIFVCSAFSKSVFIYDLRDFSLIREVTFITADEGVAIPPLITGTGLSHELNDELRTKSMIANIGYIVNQEKYVFLKRTDISKKKEKENIPFEVIILNENFEIEETIEFSGKDFFWYGSFITQEGILLMSKKKGNFGIKTYGLFKI